MLFIYFFLVGLVTGIVVGALIKGLGFGLVGNATVGVIGSMVIGYLFSIYFPNNLVLLLIIAFMGAVVFLNLANFIKRKS